MRKEGKEWREGYTVPSSEGSDGRDRMGNRPCRTRETGRFQERGNQEKRQEGQQGGIDSAVCTCIRKRAHVTDQVISYPVLACHCSS